MEMLRKQIDFNEFLINYNISWKWRSSYTKETFRL